MIVRLLALDLDGTTLGSDRRIAPGNREAIQRATQAGMEVVLASGRIWPSMRGFAEDLALTQAAICANGAQVRLSDGEDLRHLSVSTNVRAAVDAYAEERNIHVNYYTRDGVFWTSPSPWGEVYERRLRTSSLQAQVISRAQLADLNVLKLMLVDEPLEIQRHAARLRGELSAADVTITESEPEYLEFLAPEADKGSALAALAKLRGFGRHQVAAIGDYLNDLGMVQYAGVSAAVANAAEAVKREATMVVASNENGGVSEFIDRLLS